jgi:DNA-binding transcriptional LysR family regulator
MHNGNWDDLRFVLAVAQTGSVSAAAKTLGVNHATVLRRITAFETLHGAAVFDRGPRGYSVRPDQRRLIEAAREVEAGFAAIDRLMAGARMPIAGVVRVTSTDTFTGVILPDILAEIALREPALRVELLTGNLHADFARLHADVAVRPAMTLPEDLKGDVAAELGFAVYAAQGAETAPWLGLSGALSRSVAALWLADQADAGHVAGAADSFVTLPAMARTGAGRAVLPCVLGDADPDLRRLGGHDPIPRVPVWVACHADLIDAPRLKAMRRVLGEGLAARATILAGNV